MPSTVAARPVRRAAEETDPRPVDAVLAAAMAVLVSVAATALGHDDEAAARALEQIRSAASATVRELRNTVKLQGMTERAGLLGGTLTAGDRDGGGFEVHATPPRRLGS